MTEPLDDPHTTDPDEDEPTVADGRNASFGSPGWFGSASGGVSLEAESTIYDDDELGGEG